MSKKIEKGIFIIGYRKAGTTTIFDVLSRKTGISPTIKEPQFFVRNRTLLMKILNGTNQKWSERIS